MTTRTLTVALALAAWSAAIAAAPPQEPIQPIRPLLVANAA